MKIRTKVTQEYSCDVCGTAYDTPSKAQRCERRTIETPVVAIGARVRLREKRQCLMNQRVNSGYYTAEGTISRISAPQPPNEEYENKWLGGKSLRLNSHVRVYFVHYQCPHCKEWRDQPVYAPEFTVIKKP
jgi:hypothetical protein